MESLTQAERQRASSYVGESHDRVLQILRDLSEEQVRFKPGPDRWCIGEVAEHLIIIHTLVQNHVEQLAASPVQTPQSAWKGLDDAIVAVSKDRTNRLVVPEIGRPTNGLSRDELLVRLSAIRDRIRNFVETTDAPLRDLCFPHPIHGQKDCYQWILSVAAHCERHLEQVHEVMSTDDFPKTH